MTNTCIGDQESITIEYLNTCILELLNSWWLSFVDFVVTPHY